MLYEALNGRVVLLGAWQHEDDPESKEPRVMEVEVLPTSVANLVQVAKDGMWGGKEKIGESKIETDVCIHRCMQLFYLSLSPLLSTLSLSIYLSLRPPPPSRPLSPSVLSPLSLCI